MPVADIQEQILHRRKRARPAEGSRELLRAEYPHHVWAIDFQFAKAIDGHTFKFLNVVDEFSRFWLETRVNSCCQPVVMIDTIEDLVKLYPPFILLCMDNGPEFGPHALQAWRKRSRSSIATLSQVHPCWIPVWNP
ncbi:hypothetical protein [Cyanobium sp. ATX 6A2]|uniref:hypothetical protein n=1 Tax=Cyanobium sp. ATX 6A2 TaxID=2823700 RepID=UPI0020CFA0BF|nr:hypothetical protein [Cyanobium sp. ATX 6A2]